MQKVNQMTSEKNQKVFQLLTPIAVNLSSVIRTMVLEANPSTLTFLTNLFRCKRINLIFKLHLTNSIKSKKLSLQNIVFFRFRKCVIKYLWMVFDLTTKELNINNNNNNSKKISCDHWVTWNLKATLRSQINEYSIN